MLVASYNSRLQLTLIMDTDGKNSRLQNCILPGEGHMWLVNEADWRQNGGRIEIEKERPRDQVPNLAWLLGAGWNGVRTRVWAVRGI